MTITRHIFLSFSHQDLDQVILFRGQAKNENSLLNFDDYSVKEAFNSRNAEYIKRQIREKIRRCSITIVFLTIHSASSEWVEWEVSESLKQGKNVFAVMPQGEKISLQYAKPILRYLDVVPWNHRAIMDKINRL